MTKQQTDRMYELDDLLTLHGMLCRSDMRELEELRGLWWEEEDRKRGNARSRADAATQLGLHY